MEAARRERDLSLGKMTGSNSHGAAAAPPAGGISFAVLVCTRSPANTAVATSTERYANGCVVCRTAEPIAIRLRGRHEALKIGRLRRTWLNGRQGTADIAQEPAEPHAGHDDERDGCAGSVSPRVPGAAGHVENVAGDQRHPAILP